MNRDICAYFKDSRDDGSFLLYTGIWCFYLVILENLMLS